jgi:hypothetical protein
MGRWLFGVLVATGLGCGGEPTAGILKPVKDAGTSFGDGRAKDGAVDTGVPRNGPCDIDSDCAEGLRCVEFPPGTCDFLCAVPRHVGLEVPCGEVGSICPAGYYCFGSAPALCRPGESPCVTADR